MKLRTCNPSVRTSLLMLLSLLFVMSVTLPVFSVYSQPTGKTAEVVTQEPLVPQEDIPPAVGEELAAERGHMLRLRASEGNLNTVVFRNQDQTQTMYVFNHPVKYVNTVGEIKDISIEIADSTKEQGAFVTKDAYVQTFFPRDLYDGVTISADDVSIRSVPVAPASKAASRAYRVDSETVAYPYGDKTSIEYTLTYTGYKEDIVVSSYTGQTEYQFRLYTGGLQLIREDCSYYLADSNGKLRATIGDIIVFTADERNNCMGSMTHVTVKPNEEYLLTIHLDVDYLKDEKTAYPIRIDPTIEILYEQNGEGAIEDVTINSLEGSSGSSGSLFIGKRDTYGISRVLMKFPGLSEDLVASADQILKAEVELRDILGGSTAMTVTCHIFTGGTWDEDTASWTSVNPNSYGTSISSNSVSYSNGTSISHRYSFDITGAVEGWYGGTYNREQGILFKAPSSVENGSTVFSKTFASYNRSSYQPSLSVVYTNPFYSQFEDSSFTANGETITIKGTKSLYASTSDFQYRANCYGYALQTHLDYAISDLSALSVRQYPGEFIDKTSAISVPLMGQQSFQLINKMSVWSLWNTHLFPILEEPSPTAEQQTFLQSTVRFLIQSDLQSMGYSAQFTNSSAATLPTTASKRLVIMVLGDNVDGDGTNDFHFYLQHTDGTWSHKRGLTATADSNHLSTAAEVLSNAESLKYDNYTFYFYVTLPASRDLSHTLVQDGTPEGKWSSVESTKDLAGEYFVSAQRFAFGETVEGSIGYAGDIDTFVFKAQQPQYLLRAPVISAESSPLKIAVYNESGELLQAGSIDQSFSLLNLPSGLIYIRIYTAGSTNVYPSYTLTLEYLTT